MHDVHPVRIGQGQLVGQLAGAVGAAVVDDQDVHVGQGVVHPSDDQRQVLPLVVGRDDDQSALTRAFTALDSRLTAVMWLLCRCCVRCGRTNPPLCMIAAITAATPIPTSTPWTIGPHRVAGCELRLQPDLGVEVGGFEERGAGHASRRPAR